MAKEMIVKAATIEAAKAEIVEAFGVSEDKIAFEIIAEPQKKTFGLFGGADAEVKGVLVGGNPAAEARTFLLDVLREMGVADATVTIDETDDNCTLVVEGEDLGFIIGRRGETLDALQ